jgi:acetamidase/formamidase
MQRWDRRWLGYASRLHYQEFFQPELFPPKSSYLGFPYVLLRDNCISVRKDGSDESEDLSLPAKNALLNMVGHLETGGFTRQQAYALCSVAVDLRISQTLNAPNLLVSALLPLDIFM